jgi:hypothetical protein
VNDDQAEAQQARVMALYARWGRPLGLGWWRQVTFAWERGAIPGYPEAAMTCAVRWEYKSARITVDLTRVETLDDTDLEFAVVHELMHVYLGGLVEANRKEVDRAAFRMVEEHTATSLAQAVLWLRAHCENQPQQQAEAGA